MVVFVSAGCSLSGNEGSVEISRYSGESVFLSCSVKCTAQHEPDSKFRWKLPNYIEINHTINPTERRLYQGRLHMFDISSGNFSLLISNLTEEDEGLYSCWSNENQHKNFSLTVKGCTLSETEREPETKYTGDSVLLSCSCEDPNSKPEDFRWTHVESSGTEVSSETPRYKDRVHTFHKTTPSNLSLLISNLTEDDQGTYRCTVNHKTSADIRLIVKGCTLSETERETETKYTGDSVLLSCSCEDPNTKPEDFRWTHVESSGTEVSSETPRYKDRVHTFHKTTPSNLSLLISNLTEDDQGTYRCTVNHKTSADTRLIVKGCVLSEHHITKSSSAGESVILPCSCEDPQTRPEHFEWTRAAVNETLVSDTKEINGRFQTIRDSPHNLFLRISNLTETDGGLYVCSVNGKQSRHVTLTLTDPAVINALDYRYYLIFLLSLLCLMLLAAGCIFWRFARAKKGSRGSQEIQRSNDEDEVTYSTVMQIKGKKTAEILQQDDVTYSSVTDIKGKKRPHKKEEGVVYSTVADMSRSTQDDVTYSSVVHIKSHKPKSRQNNAEEATIYASVQKDKT
uniref:Ig-like domain-containing protein n=1 Tax=Cyprinus carpio TaxID=7962 RepID=A0A8C1RBT3_CYPCA